MKAKDYIEANRKAWNQVAPIHAKSTKEKLISNFKQSGFSVLDSLEEKKLLEIGIKGKSIIQLACNNGREILSLKNLGAKRVVGIDISEEFIKQAEELKREGNIEAEFIVSDVNELPERLYNSFDMVYISIGVISWMPDIKKFFSTCSKLLQNGGYIFIYEMHPFVNMIDIPKQDSDGSPQVTLSYFNKEANMETSTLDYYEDTAYESLPQYWFAHKLSDVIMGLIESGMQIDFFEEYSHDISHQFKPLEKFNKIPLSYILIGRNV